MSPKKQDAASTTKHVILFNISGLIGTGLFYLAYDQVFALIPEDLGPKRATFAWCISYMMSIWWQHALHRYMVFGAEGPYWNSLIWTYVAYTLSLLLSTGGNFFLASVLGLNHQISFLVSLVGTGVLNYFTVSEAFKTPEKDAAAAGGVEMTGKKRTIHIKPDHSD